MSLALSLHPLLPVPPPPHQQNTNTAEAAKKIVSEEGWLALFGRGLGTRILANGLQGLLFSVLWKLFQDLWEKKVSHTK